jgi:hypothetical protein
MEVVWPIRPDASVHRLLDKLKPDADAAGYMLIMQSRNAKARRKIIDANKLARPIWTFTDTEISYSTQYHPKSVKGNVMPELDTMWPSTEHPDPMAEAMSPWHGFPGNFEDYLPAMKRTRHLQIVNVKLRLAPGESDVHGAAKGWRDIFGVPLIGNTLVFSNATMEFLEGASGVREGLESVTLNVEGKTNFDNILNRASEEGLCGDGWINLCGIKWYFVYIGETQKSRI